MNRTMLQVVSLAAVLTVGVAGPAFASPPADKESHGKKSSGKRGQNWTGFAAIFDTDKDGKVSKAEFLAKRPAFDRADTSKDGSVTQEEFKALPAVQKKGGTGSGFMERFDTDKDGKVTAAEYDQKRTKLFEAIDKNKDGAIDQDEFKGHPKEAEDSGM